MKDNEKSMTGPWLTLVAAPSGVDVHPALHRVEAALMAGGAERPHRHWLREGQVCRLRHEAPPPAGGFVTLLEGEEADIISVPEGARRKKLFLSDMDSTIIQQECIDEVARELGLGDKVAEITERSMRGELVFETSLCERVALLKGLPVEKLQEVYEARITVTPGAVELLQGLRAQGVACALVSGGFTFFTSRVAERLGFQHHVANELEVEGGCLTGRVKAPVFGPAGKAEVLEKLAAEMRIAHEEVVAVGDGANDLPMLRKAGLGVAFHAKPKVRAVVEAQINFGTLEVLGWVLGSE